MSWKKFSGWSNTLLRGHRLEHVIGTHPYDCLRRSCRRERGLSRSVSQHHGPHSPALRFGELRRTDRAFRICHINDGVEENVIASLFCEAISPGIACQVLDTCCICPIRCAPSQRRSRADCFAALAKTVVGNVIARLFCEAISPGVSGRRSPLVTFAKIASLCSG